MTLRSLFNIILKILGLLFIDDILSLLSQFLTVAVLLPDFETGNEVLVTLLPTTVLLAFYCAIFYFLVFRSGFLIDKLRLDKGFGQESFSLNIHRSTILSISIIVIGGLMLADEIPALGWRLYEYYEQSQTIIGSMFSIKSRLIFSGLKILIGLLLIGNHREIVNYIERKRRKR